jgi:hypothetical protein
MIIDIRGTHGSGKSWIVHKLLYGLGLAPTPIVENGYHIDYQTIIGAVVGKYETACGGCDGVPTADEVVRRVRLFSSKYRAVILEGILVAHTYGRYNALAEEMEAAGIPYHFCFMNTPLKTCVARVLARRRVRGDARPFNPDNLIKDWHQIWIKTRTKLVAAGRRVVILDYRAPLPRLLKLLESKPPALKNTSSLLERG